MAEEEKTVLLTQEAYDKLQKELAYRQGDYRDEITQRIATARAEGDLSENGGYQAAREEQGKNEGRINELIVKLRNTKILKAPPAEGGQRLIGHRGACGQGDEVRARLP